MTANIDLSQAALLIADVQADYLAADGFLARAGRAPMSLDDIAAMSSEIQKLAAMFRAKGRPVIWARNAFRADMVDCAWGPGWAERQFGAAHGFLVEGTAGADWLAGIGPEANDIVLTRGAHGVFAGTSLDRILANLAARDLLLAGGPLSASLSDTARSGAALGYRVFIAGEAVFPPLQSYPSISSAQALTSAEILAAPAQAPAARSERSAFLVIDMQNHFLFPQKDDEEARQKNFARNAELVRHCAALADHLRAKGWPVIWIKTGRRADRVDTAMHKLREDILLSGDSLLLDGTWGAELADGLTPASEDYVLYKRGQSGFSFTPLHRALRNLGITHCLLSGGAASGCLGATLRDGAVLGYDFSIVEDAVYPVGSKYMAVLENYAAMRRAADILGNR
ncbi:MAG TPA: isochorismatase family cysteine hydrolase [Alphaproteobacteria bacterium]|nr:isochorismatase family cysteine hydrolase [Alphaproteobacteria bacterium]